MDSEPEDEGSDPIAVVLVTRRQGRALLDEAGWKPGDLRAVVFAQDPKTRGILGVASIALQ